jgi:hypothetical protein
MPHDTSPIIDDIPKAGHDDPRRQAHTSTMRKRLVAGEGVARLCQELGLAWLKRQADVGDELVAQRKRMAEKRPCQ